MARLSDFIELDPTLELRELNLIAVSVQRRAQAALTDSPLQHELIELHAKLADLMTEVPQGGYRLVSD
jgi:hypothetical protein